jgi:hypothetical protein
VLRVNACREGLSVSSTAANKDEMRWKIFSRALNAKILIGFLERLTRQQKAKIFLILDNLRVHHSNAGTARLPSLPPFPNRAGLSAQRTVPGFVSGAYSLRTIEQ